MGQYTDLIEESEAAEAASDVAHDKVNQAVADLENQLLAEQKRRQAAESAEAAAEADDALDEQTISDLNAEIKRLEALLDDVDVPDPPPPDPDPEDGLDVQTALFGAATTNNKVEAKKLDTAWGPIRDDKEYDGGKGIVPVDQYSWFGFVTDWGFPYMSFSADAQKSTTSYTDIANGKHDDEWSALLKSVKAKMPKQQGVICIGNEPNVSGGVDDPHAYRAAVEHLIDKFGYLPVDGWMWGVAFSNYNVFGPGSGGVGREWLPRRDKGPFMVETHFYGRSGYGDPAKNLGLLMTEMKKHPTWYWGIGEISAQEDPTHTKKGQWFTDVAAFTEKNNGKYLLMFDTNVGGSADIATSPQTTQAVKAIAERWKSKQWDLRVTA